MLVPHWRYCCIFSLLLFHFWSTCAYVIVLPWERIFKGHAFEFLSLQLVSCFDYTSLVQVLPLFFLRTTLRTSSEFKVRFHSHKLAMSTKKITSEVGVHFKKDEHQLSDFKFIVVEQICSIDNKHNVDKRLLTRETFWCSQLCTLQPYDLNKRSEFNTRNRIKYNWHISPIESHFSLLLIIF